MGAAIVFLLAIPAVLMVLAGLIVLQIFLARKKSLLPGLVMPALFVLGTAGTAVGMVLTTGAVRSAVTLCLAGGLPALLLAGVFLIARLVSKKNAAHTPETGENKELNRMNIQDLG